MKKTFAVILAVLLVIAFAGCKQDAYPLPPSGLNPGVPEDSRPADTRALLEELNKQLPEDAEKVLNGEFVKGLSIPEISTTSMQKAAPRAEEEYPVTFKFTEYEVGDYGTINDGTFTLRYKGSAVTEGSKTTYSFESQAIDLENLIVQKSDSTVTKTISVKNLTKSAKVTIEVDEANNTTTVSGMKESMNIIQSITAETQITINNSNVPVQDVAEVETPDGPFAGGLGTEAFPYIIKSEEDFMEIADYDTAMLNGDYIFFDVVNDLDFSGMDDIGLKRFRGELDFNGNELRGVSSDQLQSGLYTLINDIIEGKIANLEYRPDEMVALAYTSGWTSDVESSRDEWITSFENVNVYGEFRDIANNASLYILQAFKGALEFHNCTSDVFATGDSYDGVFLGGYAQKDTPRLVFENCVNEGTLIVKNAGLLTGNSTYTPKEVIVKNCVNNGLVIGTEGSGAFCGLTPESDAISKLNEESEANITGSGKIYTLGKTLNATYDADSEMLTITSTSDEAVTYKISGKS